ncbi:MAG TPA: hypothetical protein VM680_06140, partial [Verrucomicrobiae bacterium]|nr:hypothetical protein [Verrucomicrobiae bacterium]
APFDFSRWRNLPVILMLVGAVISVLGFFVNRTQFGYSWLQNFMFFLTIAVGGWFLLLVHHLFDASWSVPIRRITESLASLLPWMAIFFIPIYLLRRNIYPWLGMLARGESDHALHSKAGLFSEPGFLIVSAACFLIWWLNISSLRRHSLKQDADGAAIWTLKSRREACWGIVMFALTVTMGVIMWMKSLQHQWFSTMYGVYFFAGATWTTLATVYVLTMIFHRQGFLRGVIFEKQYYFIGSLFFAFTVFYAYIHFSQFFIIWNANIPEETFWYYIRTHNGWRQVGLVLIFGHFFLPFLSLLRIDAKLNYTVMVPMAIWAWLMHYTDMVFNIQPAMGPSREMGPVLHWMDIAIFAFMLGFVSWRFFSNYFAHPPYPQRDPRIAEGLDVYVPPLSGAKAEPKASH